jgi:dinuclear metal center YbgI/SA1388 family protein
MSVSRHTLAQYLQDILGSNQIKDYCPNGLQIEGKSTISTIVTGVTASQALLQKALEVQADAIIVHHGYFFKNEQAVLTGMKKKRIETLIKNDMNLFAYHLPLDVHPTLGNNHEMAQKLELQSVVSLDTGTNPPLGLIGNLPVEQNVDKLVDKLMHILDRKPLLIEGGERTVRQVALCTGAGQDFIEHAYTAGADVYISGEISERTTHFAREAPIHYLASGHHATETFGVYALGQHLAQQFQIQHQFFDINNPA